MSEEVETSERDVNPIREKLDAEELVKRRIEDCQNRLAAVSYLLPWTIDNFVNAVDGLYIYCDVIGNDDFRNRIKTLKALIQTKVESNRAQDNSISYSTYTKVFFETYKEIFTLCIKEINRNNMLFRREITNIV